MTICSVSNIFISCKVSTLAVSVTNEYLATHLLRMYFFRYVVYTIFIYKDLIFISLHRPSNEIF